MKLSPGSAVTATWIRSERTRVPPVTALRSPPASRITGADSPVIADSSTVATPSIDLPVGGDDLPGAHDHDISLAQTLRGDLLRASRPAESGWPCPGARLAEGVGLGLAPSLRHRLGEIGEEHREPEPDGHLKAESQRLVRRAEEKADGGEKGADLGDEHHRVFHQRPRVQLRKRRGGGLPEDPASNREWALTAMEGSSLEDDVGMVIMKCSTIGPRTAPGRR